MSTTQAPKSLKNPLNLLEKNPMSTTKAPTQAQKARTFDFYEDPGHGWLKVPRDLLQGLGIADKISTYSYMRGQWAYLEEDCDFSTFEQALHAAGFGVSVRTHHTDKRSKIRGYSTYRAGC